MKLIWHAAELAERDWFLWLLGDVVDEEVHDLDLRYEGDDAIHVVSGNVAPMRSYRNYFERLRARSLNITLLHASDEWFSGGYGMYRYFDRVLRTHRTWLAAGPGILQFPLGYPNGLAHDGPIKPAPDRSHVWVFAGGIKASRAAMAKALASIEPALLIDTALPGVRPLSRDGYAAAMDDSVFAPCPMGNVMIETWRLYEALERGCIPLAERRPTMNYYRRLFGPNPIPTFGSWSRAADFVQRLIDDPDALARKQVEVHRWWTARKQSLRDEVARFMRAPGENAALRRYSEKLRNRIGPAHETLRLAELVRHQSAGSFGRWLRQPGRIVRRALRDSF